jgi:hypothetical protein
MALQLHHSSASWEHFFQDYDPSCLPNNHGHEISATLPNVKPFSNFTTAAQSQPTNP